VLDNHGTWKKKKRHNTRKLDIISANKGALRERLGLSAEKVARLWTEYLKLDRPSYKLVSHDSGRTAFEKLVACHATGVGITHQRIPRSNEIANTILRFINDKTELANPSEEHLHLFFLFYPEKKWKGQLFTRIRSGRTTSSRLLGISDDLNALVHWMMFIKKLYEDRRDSKYTRDKPILLDLLIPAPTT
jgi:hypothetical protein